MVTKGKKVIVVLTILMILSTGAFAIALLTDSIGPSLRHGMPSVVGEVVGGIIRDALYTGFIGEAFFDPVRDALQPSEFFNILQQSNPELILADGDVNPIIDNKVNFFIQLLAPFYLLAFLLLAIYLMFISSSPEGRARAKGSLLRLILSVAFVIFTIPIVQAFLDVSLYLTNFIINTNSGNMEIALKVLRICVDHMWNTIKWKMPFLAFWPMLFIFLFSIILSSIPFIIICMRYFMILVFTMLFPIGIFLYSIHFTQRLGKSIIRQTILWIFIQPLMAIILAVIGIASTPLLSLVSDSTMETGFGLAGFLALGAAPLVMVGIMNWLEALLVLAEAAMEVPSMHLVAEIEELKIKE